MNLDILAIGAHPDDVELSCAGTLAKAVKHGAKVAIIDLTEGELGTRGDRVIRAKEATKAASILGCRRENLGLPDGGIEVSERNIKLLIRSIRKFRPKILLIPHWMERHPDHVHTHHLCREAWFYSGLRKLRTTLNGKAQEPWRPHNYYHFMQWYEFIPSFIVDISDAYQIRMESIKAHKSQFFNPDSKEPQTFLSTESFFDLVETRAKNYGIKIGAKYGEPFYSVESVGIDNLFDLRMFKG
jgi:N-acetylglucosamine malate deacetylase 1